MGADSKNASPTPKLLGETVEGRETKMSRMKSFSCFLRYFFTCEERVGIFVSSYAKATPEEDTVLFLGAMKSRRRKLKAYKEKKRL